MFVLYTHTAMLSASFITLH